MLIVPEPALRKGQTSKPKEHAARDLVKPGHSIRLHKVGIDANSEMTTEFVVEARTGRKPKFCLNSTRHECCKKGIARPPHCPHAELQMWRDRTLIGDRKANSSQKLLHTVVNHSLAKLTRQGESELNVR